MAAKRRKVTSRTRTTTKKKSTAAKPARKRTTRRKKTTSSGAGPGFSLRASSGLELEFQGGPKLQRLAMHWGYAVRNRLRWRASASAYRDMQRRAEEDLRSIPLAGSDACVTDEDLDALADSTVVEVSTKFERENDGWECRILPWEYFLSSATRSRRVDRPFMVIRHLDRRGGRRRPPESMRGLIVESGPGELGEIFTFDSELGVLSAIQGVSWQSIATPTARTLEADVKKRKPHVIHLSGVDAHQGSALLGLPADEQRRDGLYVLGEGRVPVVLEAQPLAETLNAATVPPVLVTCNAYNSAARISPLIVAGGATAAIGIQDEIDDTLSELFFASFYRAWTVSNYDTLRAFDLAMQELRHHPVSLRGSGIVLWSAESLLASARRPRSAEATRVKKELEKRQQQVIRVTGTGDGVREVLHVDPRPHPNLNYAMLHNNRDLFKSFKLRTLRQGVLKDVRVEVILYVGSEAFPYRASFDLDDPVRDIREEVRVPLTWEFVRTLQETVRTSLYVNVSHGDHVVYQDTHPISLLPVNEWKDNERDGFWLPSFVLPRDPAVARIIDRAQCYLSALADDHNVGFDGYQSMDPDAEDPWEGVDLQVRAIWSALVCDLDLKYINPPPTYTESSQRLRSPTDVEGGGRGTCIDLTLLLAACLEYVEIYPVVFLLKGHAFPGYWRSEESQQRFVEMGHLFEARGPLPTAAIGSDGQRTAWMVQHRAYGEVIDLIESDDLVPLESVWLTTHEGFAAAWEAGLDNLKDPDEFDGMLDIRQARHAGVTPVPLRGGTR